MKSIISILIASIGILGAQTKTVGPSGEGITSGTRSAFLDALGGTSAGKSLFQMSGTPTSGQVPTWNGTVWAPATPGGGSFSSLTGNPTDNALLSSALGLKVNTADLSTAGGEDKVPQFDSLGNLSLGISNRTSLGAGGNLLMAPFREIKFLNANGTDSASIYLWDGHSGGDELIIDSKRICFYWQDGMQFGSPASLRDGRHIYFQPNAATVSDTVVESPPVALMSRYWDGSANANQTTWMQVVPSSAAANTEVLNINFGGSVGADHRLTGGVTPVQINRSGILAAGTIQGGVWNGTAIADAYISSAALWTPISGVLATSQTFTGTTTFADITGVTVSLPAGTYSVEALATATVANGTMGQKFQLVASGTGVINNGFSKLTANGLTNQPEYALNYGNLSFSDARTLTGAQPGIYTARFVVVVASGTATIKLQAAQNVSDGGNLTVLSGAAIIARKLQ